MTKIAKRLVVSNVDLDWGTIIHDSIVYLEMDDVFEYCEKFKKNKGKKNKGKENKGKKKIKPRDVVVHINDNPILIELTNSQYNKLKEKKVMLLSELKK